MTKRTTEAVRFSPLQFRVRHPCNINKAAHPQNGVQEKAGKVDHPLIRVALQEVVNHHRRFFKVASKVAQTITHRLRNIITPGDSDRSNNIRV
ncbi:Uncharacterised protein [Shigella flexneri]|nr:Uncharacterised protein [Shigella flexneri]